ncbi:MAG: hypothetical protein KGL95_01800 [Patescibacteria group bacterium]|nr:hypothetical protein [Nitrososphaerota archaeon]MDE2588386.1 hypothetical protein [Patescibacteria group bacterium]
MKVPFGIIILVGGLLIGVFVMADFLIPHVICKIIPPSTSIKQYAGQYNPDIFGDICSALH